MLARRVTGALLAGLLFLFMPVAALAAEVSGEDEVSDGFFTMVDEAGRELLTTAHFLFGGDQFIDERNRLYKVVSVDGRTAKAKYMGTVRLTGAAPIEYLKSVFGWARALPAITGSNQAKIAIYHTHSDEAYIPSDGAPNIPRRGGIFKVGASFKRALEKNGFTAIQNTTPHDPHDDRAYDRSRRTAVTLMKKEMPAAIFDVHRDAIPSRAEYERKVAGKVVNRVMLVVGRENPRQAQNLAFAKKIKAEADRVHPGLIRGIFMGLGDYNQDLSNRAMLLEVGTHVTRREDAEEGIALLADALPRVLGVRTAAPARRPGPGPADVESRAARSTTVFLIIALVVGVLVYLVISTGGWREASRKVRNMFGREFANFLGSLRSPARKRRRGRREPPEREPPPDSSGECGGPESTL